jgi:hypothetical protein
MPMRPIEKIVFEKFIANRPDFAGRPVSWEEGDDPPDVLCKDEAGKLIGVELAEWLNEDQMQASKLRESIEGSYDEALQSKKTTAPTNIGLVWLSRKKEVRLAKADYGSFRDEVYDLIAEINKTLKPDYLNGELIHDFGARPTLQKYLDHIRVFHIDRFAYCPGSRWVAFPADAAWYHPNSAVEALEIILEKKTAKYSDLHITQNLDELYLLIYYLQGFQHNTPYKAPHFDFKDVAESTRSVVEKDHGKFQKIFLFNSLDGMIECAELWPY